MNKIKRMLNAVTDNPIIKREIKQTFRKPRIFWILAVYLFALAGAAFIVFGSVAGMYSDDFSPANSAMLYYIILGMQIMLMTFIAPITTSTAISGERERQTFDLLIITKTSMYDIILGKLLSSLMIIGIMIVLGMPVYAVVFYYGGVSVVQFIFNLLYVICYVTMVGSLGIAFSTVMKKSTAASTATVLMIFASAIGIWVPILMITAMLHSLTLYPMAMRELELWRIPGSLIVFNPFISFMSMIDNQMGTDYSWEVLSEIGFDMENKFVYAWHINMLLYILLTHILIKFSAKRIAPIRKK